MAFELCFISRFGGYALALGAIVLISLIAGKVKLALVFGVLGALLLAATHYWSSRGGFSDLQSSSFLIVLIAAVVAIIAVYLVVTRTGD